MKESIHKNYDDPPLFAGRASVLGYYSSRPATRDDFERATALLDVGHQTFAELGLSHTAGGQPHGGSQGAIHPMGNRPRERRWQLMLCFPCQRDSRSFRFPTRSGSTISSTRPSPCCLSPLLVSSIPFWQS